MLSQTPTIIEECSFDKIYQLALNNEIDALKKLVASNVCIDVNKNNQTPVYLLTFNEKYTAAKLLLDEFNASLDEAVKGAAETNNVSFTHQLLAEGANVNFAIEGAARGNHITLLNDLLASGGSIDSALQGAATKNQTELIDHLLKQKGKISALMCGAGLGGQLELLKSLIINRKNVDLNYAVFGLAIINEIDYVNKLINEHKADIKYAVQGAAQGGHASSVLSYIQKGASLNYAVWGAGSGGHTNLTFYLIELGANQDWALEGAIAGNQFNLINNLINKEIKKEYVVSKFSSDHILNNQKRFFRLLAYINDKNICEELINIAMLEKPSFDKEKLLQESIYANKLITNGFNLNQALLWINLSEEDKNVLAVWFLQGIQLIDKKLIHLEILIHIATHLLQQPFNVTMDLYKKCSNNRSVFFLNKNQTTTQEEKNNHSLYIKKLF